VLCSGLRLQTRSNKAGSIHHHWTYPSVIFHSWNSSWKFHKTLDFPAKSCLARVLNTHSAWAVADLIYLLLESATATGPGWGGEGADRHRCKPNWWIFTGARGQTNREWSGKEFQRAMKYASCKLLCSHTFPREPIEPGRALPHGSHRHYTICSYFLFLSHTSQLTAFHRHFLTHLTMLFQLPVFTYKSPPVETFIAQLVKKFIAF
jgi:hypothetical protein